MKTYAESRNNKPFDWNKTLLDLIERDKNNYLYKRKKEFELQQLAESWVTCACGNQCDVIPRDAFAAPLDNTLNGLGVKFSSCINCSNWEDALDILELIEIRSSQLIKKINLESK